MFRSGALALLSATAICAAAPSSATAASFLTVGANSLCGEGGCFVGKKSYSQTFSSSERGGGVVDVSQLLVNKGVVGAVEHTAVKVTFVLADGTEVSWGRFSVLALGGEVVTLGGDTVNWNTSLGDLTVRLDLIVPDKGGVGGGGGFGGGLGGGWAAGGGGASDDGGGFKVVGGPLIRPSLPSQAAIAAIPEPGAWALMVMGFGAAGAVLRGRRRYHHRYG